MKSLPNPSKYRCGEQWHTLAAPFHHLNWWIHLRFHNSIFIIYDSVEAVTKQYKCCHRRKGRSCTQPVDDMQTVLNQLRNVLVLNVASFAVTVCDCELSVSHCQRLTLWTIGSASTESRTCLEAKAQVCICGLQNHLRIHSRPYSLITFHLRRHYPTLILQRYQWCVQCLVSFVIGTVVEVLLLYLYNIKMVRITVEKKNYLWF